MGHWHLASQNARGQQEDFSRYGRRGAGRSARGMSSTTVRMAVQRIEAFDRARAPLRLADVAERAGVDRAVARRMLLTLIELGLVTEAQRHYQLTARVLRLGVFVPVADRARWDCAAVNSRGGAT